MNEIMPVISDEKIIDVVRLLGIFSESSLECDRAIAKAQNKADRKWMVEWIGKNCYIWHDEWNTDHISLDKEALLALKEAIDE